MFKPIRDFVLCKAIVNENKKGAILLTTDEFSYKYTVVEIGSDVQYVSKDQVIQAEKLRYPTIESNGGQLTLIPEKHILGIYCDYEV